MNEKIQKIEEFILSCFEGEHDSSQLLRSLEILESFIAPNTIDQAELLGEAYESIQTVYNAEKAYFYYQLYYSQNEYSIGWRDQNDSPSYYGGPVGDFRNEAPVSDLVVDLGFEKCQEIDSQAKEWLKNNGLKYELFHDEEG